jgi:hypothetical protein
MERDRDDITCPICVDVVEDNRQCSFCRKHFCLKCIADWMSQHDDCPCCRGKFDAAQRDPQNWFHNKPLEALAQKTETVCKLCNQKLEHGSGAYVCQPDAEVCFNRESKRA